MKIKAFIIMGVSGCGKSTIARLLAEKLDWDFYDADDFHPADNIAKMAAGIPLIDNDRVPWLAALNEMLAAQLKAGKHPILACSALKKSYRDKLKIGNDGLQVIYLQGDYDTILSRLAARRGHYMQVSMLKSQFDALEEPLDALVLDIRLNPEGIVNQIMQYFQL